MCGRVLAGYDSIHSSGMCPTITLFSATHFGRALLTQVASGQEQRNVSDTSIALLTKKLNSIEDLRFDALEFDADGNPLRHSNAASNVFKLKLPMEL